MCSPAADLRLKAPGSDVQLMLNTSVISSLAAGLRLSRGWISSSSSSLFLTVFQGQSRMMFVFCFIIHAHWCCDGYSGGTSFWSGHQERLAPECSENAPPDCCADWPFLPNALTRGNPLQRAGADRHKASLISRRLSQDQRTEFFYPESVFLRWKLQHHYSTNLKIYWHTVF